jgi:hypothetical protein
MSKNESISRFQSLPHQYNRKWFNLAVECGNIQVAVASAKEIDKDYW